MGDGWLGAAVGPDLYGQLAATDPYQRRARRLFERGQVVAVSGNQADLRVGFGVRGEALELKQVPVVSGYVPAMGDWVAIQYEAGHSGAPWVTGPSMAADVVADPAGVGVFPVASEEPDSPHRSTIYFDETRGTWRGWDGSAWVDFASKLHNGLPDLQGGAAGAYYHLSSAEHGAVQDLYDGDGMASAWVKRLRFKALDASATARTSLFERDGDCFWAINASYDAATDTWARLDTTKYAYLMELRSQNGIPTEPLGGIVWWRAAPGANPINGYTGVGGWELGFMMTEHRNYVMGGMNLELDGSGAPPYGRLTHIGSEDASGTVVTALQRNSWYEGGGQWARDSHDKNSAAIGFDANADLFVWWYPDSSQGNAPWGTAAWQRRMHMHLGADGIRGRLDVTRASSVTNLPGSSFLAKHETSGDMADGFGAGYLFAIEDNAGTENVIAALHGLRDGGDANGALAVSVAASGVLSERVRVSAKGLGIGRAAVCDLDVYSQSAVSFNVLLSLLHPNMSAGNHAGPLAFGVAASSRNAGVLSFVKSATAGDEYVNLAVWGVTNLLRVYGKGQLQSAAGSANAPAYSFIGASGDGIFHPAADTVGVAVNGAEVGRWTAAGLSMGGECKCGSLRVDQTPATETITPDRTITINCNGASYKVPVKAA